MSVQVRAWVAIALLPISGGFLWLTAWSVTERHWAYAGASLLCLFWSIGTGSRIARKL